ncbi:hypothetical protein Ct9H90mP29_14660 [bacterium]|nr:MAG: hypothetical protein Ct9H90mP29_14660 [bacterium]
MAMVLKCLDELGNVIWTLDGSRTSPYSMNTTSEVVIYLPLQVMFQGRLDLKVI